MKKSITIIGKNVDHVYVIKDVDVDKVTVEKYNVECRNNIESAWGDIQDQMSSSNSDDQTLEIVLKDKISNTTLKAKANVIEMAARAGGQILKDIVLEKTKNGKSVRLIDVTFFNVVNQKESSLL